MIGIFDSGRGGMAAAREVCRALPMADVVFLADRENAPYGTKTEGELVRLVRRDIERLKELGADTVLIACCTASTVYSLLPGWQREISVPIIEPCAARAAELTKNGKVGVIATHRTVASDAIGRAIRARTPTARVYSYEAGELVELIESGRSPRGYIERFVRSFSGTQCDTLVLGCTHFSHAKGIFSSLLPHVNIVDSATAGAEEIIKKSENFGYGRILYV